MNVCVCVCVCLCDDVCVHEWGVGDDVYVKVCVRVCVNDSVCMILFV